MNIKHTIILLFLTGILFVACKSNNNQHKMATENNSTIFPTGEKLTNGYFTGDAYLKMLLTKDANNNFAIGSVTFEPGARTNWHTHPKGQVLIVTEGQGWYQEKGKPAQVIKKGDVVNIPENIEHWHGASVESKMIHIAITNYKDEDNVAWLKAVTGEEYSAVNK
jgi:quercetin dioxygenase-like cupin family protein